MQAPALVTQLLEHLGYEAPLDPLDLLEVTLKAFSKIPYENLSKIVRTHGSGGGTPKESPEDVIEGFISRGTGGTCFPLTRTLVFLLNSLGYEACPILADRRYGTDTHCAVIFRAHDRAWQLLDPGYLIHSPCPIPNAGSTPLELPVRPIRLELSTCGSRVDLFTLRAKERGILEVCYRLMYKLTPVDEPDFNRAWDRSFSWEMMQYPVVSALVGETQLYLQKSSLLVRSRTDSTRVQLLPEQITDELGRAFGIDASVIRAAYAALGRF
jgi:arylamine N-acetyltransferase